MLKDIFRKIVPYNIRRMVYYIHNLPNMLPDIEHEINSLRKELLYLKIMEFFKNSENQAYNVELDYLKKLGAFSPFPYECTKKSLVRYRQIMIT